MQHHNEIANKKIQSLTTYPHQKKRHFHFINQFFKPFLQSGLLTNIIFFLQLIAKKGTDNLMSAPFK